MKNITKDIFFKLFLYSIFPIVLIILTFSLIIWDTELKKFDDIARKQIELMDKELFGKIDFFKNRIPQRLNHSIYRYGKIQDDLTYFIFRVKELYDIYIVDKNNIIIDGKARFDVIKKGVNLDLDNDKYQIVNNDIFILFEEELVDKTRVIYRVSIRDLFEIFTSPIQDIDFFVIDNHTHLIYYTNPIISIKNPHLKGYDFLENNNTHFSGFFKFPTESGKLEERYIFVLKNLKTDLIYGIAVSKELIKNNLKKLFIQIAIIFTIYILLLYLIAKYLSKYISKPIIELTNYSIKATSDEKVTIDINKFPQNELRVLAENLYNSIETIKCLKDELFNTIMSIGDGVIVTDESAKVILMNPVAENIIGFKLDEVKGKHIDEILQLSNEMTNEKITNPLIKAIKENKNYEVSNHTILTDRYGNKKIITDSASPIIFKDKVKGGVLIFRDDTEKERFKREMIRKQQIETIGLISGGIAHDFNNIISAINNYMLVAKSNFSENKEIVDFANNILNLCGTAKFLANKLLVLSKGGEHISVIETDLYSLISETLRFVTSGSNIKATINKFDEYYYALVDQNLISQVFHNLFLNAKQAMPHGGELTITLSIDEDVLINNRPTIKIIIQDTGTGIPKDALEKIFQPFYTTKQTGSGLGLYIVKTIIDKHDGKIYVDSEEGKGTKFIIHLPTSDRCPLLLKKDDENTKEKNFNMKVLIMDDEFFVKDSLSMLLESLGCDVISADDGDEAIKLYEDCLKKGKKPDLAFLDITVPLGKGAQYTIDKLKRIDPDVKAVVMSGYTDSDIMENFKNYGFVDFLGKPYERKRIIEILKKYSESKNVYTNKE